MLAERRAHLLTPHEDRSCLEALVWFWIIDEAYALTFVMSYDMS
jgi:hypothetical protein